MSSFLISKLKNNSPKENLNFILNIKNEEVLNDICCTILSKDDKNVVLFLLQNDKIPKSMGLYLYGFIIKNKYFDMFLELDFTKFDIHVDDDIALTMTSRYGHIDAVKHLVKNGANIHSCDNRALRESSYYGHIEVVKFLVENGANIHSNNESILKYSSEEGRIGMIKMILKTDLEYYSKNKIAIDIVKKNRLFEFYEKFGINSDEILSSSVSQSWTDVLRYINIQDLESLKKCNQFNFSTNGYYFFFCALELNNPEIIKVIFDFIKNKENLKKTFDDISPYFNENIKNVFNQLFKNNELNNIKNNLENLLSEIRL